ncbi:hypothetical protein ABMY35_00860 [Pseudoalteromonas sp. BZB3]|uniref:hypothetical protein n=1 Tax=Pseudoalteromonas sp. BZB3 TaxID=3136670 RepID=UPI0032C3E046
MSVIDKFYALSPRPIQNLMCSIYGYLENKKRFNGHFYDSLNLLLESQFFESDKIDLLKKSKLSSALILAKGSGLYPSLREYNDADIYENPFTILSKMPVLSKNDLRELDLASLPNTPHTYLQTSGTTGKSLSVPRDLKMTAFQWAIWFRHRSRFGIKQGDLSLNFTGKPIAPLNSGSKKVWRYNYFQKQFLLGMQSINRDTIAEIVQFINSKRFVFFSGYPSIIYQLASLALEQGLELKSSSKPKVIFFGAENVLQYQKDTIQLWLGNDTVLTDQYGLTEGNCNFSKCEHGNYHEDFEFSHIELHEPVVNEDGSRTGFLIGTSLENHYFPLIKYHTGDMATFAPEEYQCPCGRKSRVVFDVQGRVDDYAETHDGRKIMRFDYLFKDTFEVLEAQVIQEKIGEVIVCAVPSQKFEQLTFEQKVSNAVDKYIDTSMKVEFQYVDHIPKGKNGKFKAVLNRRNDS